MNVGTQSLAQVELRLGAVGELVQGAAESLQRAADLVSLRRSRNFFNANNVGTVRVARTAEYSLQVAQGGGMLRLAREMAAELRGSVVEVVNRAPSEAICSAAMGALASLENLVLDLSPGRHPDRPPSNLWRLDSVSALAKELEVFPDGASATVVREAYTRRVREVRPLSAPSVAIGQGSALYVAGSDNKPAAELVARELRTIADQMAQSEAALQRINRNSADLDTVGRAHALGELRVTSLREQIAQLASGELAPG